MINRDHLRYINLNCMQFRKLAAITLESLNDQSTDKGYRATAGNDPERQIQAGGTDY